MRRPGAAFSHFASGTQYTWSTGAITNSINVSQQGIYIGRAQTRCALVTDTIQLTVLKNPVSISDSIRRWCDSTITLDAGNPGYSYLWSPGGQTTRTIPVNQLGSYIVTVSTNGYCPLNDTFTVKSGCPIRVWVPTAFTPNKDNLNDFFSAETTGDIYEVLLWDI